MSALARYADAVSRTNDVSGPWYGLWSGFGSDPAEFGIVGAVGTGVYQLVKKYNCHEPGCWRVGTSPRLEGLRHAIGR
jgi:hypothetical protein